MVLRVYDETLSDAASAAMTRCASSGFSANPTKTQIEIMLRQLEKNIPNRGERLSRECNGLTIYYYKGNYNNINKKLDFSKDGASVTLPIAGPVVVPVVTLR